MLHVPNVKGRYPNVHVSPVETHCPLYWDTHVGRAQSSNILKINKWFNQRNNITTVAVWVRRPPFELRVYVFFWEKLFIFSCRETIDYFYIFNTVGHSKPKV